MKFGDAVKAVRSAHGFASQQAFANHLGVAIRTVAGWEAGRQPRSHHLLALLNLAAEKELTDAYQALLLGQVDPKHTELAKAMMRVENDFEQSVFQAVYEVLTDPKWDALRRSLLKLIDPVLSRTSESRRGELLESWRVMTDPKAGLPQRRRMKES